MSTTAIISAAREMLIVTLMLLTPFLLTAVLSSFVMGLFQASTRINDLTRPAICCCAAGGLFRGFLGDWPDDRVSRAVGRGDARDPRVTPC